MAVKSSGTLSYTDIKNEFGNSTGNKLGNYRVTHNLVQNGVTFRQLTLDGQNPGAAGSIPTSGTIKFSDFYSKRLSHVINIFSPGNEVEENFLNAKKIFKDNPNRVEVIGPKKSSQRRMEGGGSNVIIAVNKRVGSEKGNGTKCAIRTGVWDASCNLKIILDANADVQGAGGDGGIGADGTKYPPTGGAAGTSALGIEFQGTTIINNGSISAGFGGGGGGAGGRETSKNDRRAGGGGGGGGRGIPAGNGGRGGVPQSGAGRGGGPPPPANGKAGGNASRIAHADGGDGGDNDDQAFGGKGGDGGDPANTQTKGGNSTLDDGTATNGAAFGNNGYAIRKSNNHITYSFSGNAVIGAVDPQSVGGATGVFQGT